MGKPLHVVRTITPREGARLSSAAGSRDFTRRNRASIVLESSRGSTVGEIESKLRVNKHTVRLWIKRFNAEGIEGLESRPFPGRPPSISEEQKDEMMRIALTSPRSLGLDSSTWSLRALKEYLERNRVVKEISESWIRKVLEKRGFDTSRARNGRRAVTPTMTAR